MENLRKIKGLQIAQTKTIQEGFDGWVVPSQNSNKKYFVRKDTDRTCSCPDCKKRGVKCKHAFAVEYYLQKITRNKDGSVQIEHKRLTYPQAWKAYDKSQQEEKARFLELLNDLIGQPIEPEKRGRGQPKIRDHDMLLASALKVYSQFSLRRFMTDLKEAKEKGLVKQKPCFASVGHFIQKEEITPILKELIVLSASPLKAVESKFAIDSTGFRTTKFNGYCQQKHDTKRKHEFLKLHAVCGTKTNIITACEVTPSEGEGTGDISQFASLSIETKENGFDVQEMSADMIYNSIDNYNLINSFGGKAFIPYKSNISATARSGNRGKFWRKMYHYFKLNQEEFLQHYHARSNIESSFNMIKAKFNDLLKSKTYTAQKNELLLKVLCHNIVCVIHETNELGVIPKLGCVNNQKAV